MWWRWLRWWQRERGLTTRPPLKPLTSYTISAEMGILMDGLRRGKGSYEGKDIRRGRDRADGGRLGDQ